MTGALLFGSHQRPQLTVVSSDEGISVLVLQLPVHVLLRKAHRLQGQSRTATFATGSDSALTRNSGRCTAVQWYRMAKVRPGHGGRSRFEVLGWQRLSVDSLFLPVFRGARPTWLLVPLVTLLPKISFFTHAIALIAFSEVGARWKNYFALQSEAPTPHRQGVSRPPNTQPRPGPGLRPTHLMLFHGDVHVQISLHTARPQDRGQQKGRARYNPHVGHAVHAG
jgi:hypothetical protein